MTNNLKIMSNQQLPSSPTHSKLKEMRRIAQKTQAPADKAQLIQYLSERISQAEDALNDTEQLLQCEIKQRQKISGLIQQRNAQLQKLYQVDQRGLPQKIREKLTEILTTTVSQKVEAEEKLHEEKSKNYQFHQMYQQLKWEQKNITYRLNQQHAKQQLLNADISSLDEQNSQLENQLKEEENSFREIKDKKEALENKYLQMKVAMDRMTDIKAVLNRFFGNEDLFNDKMDLKEQKIQRVQIPTRQIQGRLPSRDLKTQPKLKPLNYTNKNQDDDFWRGDFKTKG